MALYKALAADMKSYVDDYRGRASEPWIKNEWREIEGDLWWDINGNLPKRNPPRNGLYCDTDILFAMWPEFTQFLCEVETDGQSITFRNESMQCWQKMRVTKVKAWTAADSALVCDWCEGQTHDLWASDFPTEAGLWDTRHYQNNTAQMVEISRTLYKSLFVGGETISLFAPQGMKLKPEYEDFLMRAVHLAYLTSLLLNGDMVAHGAPGTDIARLIRPTTWNTVRGFVEDRWNSKEEL